MWSVTPLLNIFMIHIYTLNLNLFIATETEPPIKFQILPPSVCILDTLLTLNIFITRVSRRCVVVFRSNQLNSLKMFIPNASKND